MEGNKLTGCQVPRAGEQRGAGGQRQGPHGHENAACRDTFDWMLEHIVWKSCSGKESGQIYLGEGLCSSDCIA